MADRFFDEKDRSGFVQDFYTPVEICSLCEVGLNTVELVEDYVFVSVIYE